MSRYYTFDRKRNLVTLSSSILKHYGIHTEHPYIPEIVEKMKEKKKFAFLLFDGMGKSLLEKHLPPDSFLRKHVAMDIDSVFPPTTVAATNAFLSSKYPKETCWLGWSQYFQEKDTIIDVFQNRDNLTKEPLPYSNPIEKIGQYISVFDQVKLTCPSTKVKTIFPSFKEGGANTLEEWLTMFNAFLLENEDALVYGYWTDPDHFAHEHGVDSIFVKDFLTRLDAIIETLSKAHPDTQFYIFADHSLVDVKWLKIDEHADFFATLIRPSSIEPRAATFFVKEDKKEEFEKLFKRYYAKYFDLLSREEVLKSNLFGEGKEHKDFLSFIGDYVAISVDKYCFDYIAPELKNSSGYIDMVAAHAGGIKEESIISLIQIN